MAENKTEMTNKNVDAAQSTADDAAELIELNEGRAKTYGFLARLYREEASQELIDEMFKLKYRVSTGNEALDKGHKLIATWLSGLWENSATELSADYMRTFFGHGYSGHAAAYPFESVYASEKRLLMQGARDEILALYRAAGLDKQESWKEGEDHIALELEYMQVLINRTVDAIKAGKDEDAFRLVKAQLNFMEDHLGGWAPLLCEQMRNFAKTTFYQGLSYMTDGFLEVDTELMRDMLSAEDDEASEGAAANSEAEAETEA